MCGQRLTNTRLGLILEPKPGLHAGRSARLSSVCNPLFPRPPCVIWGGSHQRHKELSHEKNQNFDHLPAFRRSDDCAGRESRRSSGLLFQQTRPRHRQHGDWFSGNSQEHHQYQRRSQYLRRHDLGFVAWHRSWCQPHAGRRCRIPQFADSNQRLSDTGLRLGSFQRRHSLFRPAFPWLLDDVRSFGRRRINPEKSLK